MRGHRTSSTPLFAAPSSCSPAGGIRSARLGRVLAAGAVLALAAFAALSVRDDPAHAAFPGLNGRIACSAAIGPAPADATQSRLEIVTMNPDGTDERRLTTNTASDWSPKWSPDGRRIAFIKEPHIWVMNADGSGETRLTTGAGTNTPGSWSPDGRQIVFQSTRDPLPPGAPRGSSTLEIYKMNADGSNQTRLTNNVTQDSFPAWSPDGSKIVFRSNQGGNPDLYTMNPDGTGVAPVPGNTPAEESGPAWSPDGRQLAFHSDRERFGRTNRNLEIYRMNLDGSGLTRLTVNDFSGGGDLDRDLTGYDIFPAWSPEGNRMVFHSGRAPEYRETGQTPFIAQWDVFAMNAADGSDLRRMTNRPGNDERCDWQPIRGAAPLAANVCPTPRIGTEAADTINGTPGDDRIFGLGGNDVLNGVQGNDCLFGGEGNDSLQGSEHNDRLQGDAGNDNLKGGALHDRLSGGSGRDRVLGGAGRDRLYGGAGNDSLDGGRGRNRYSAGAGNDRVNAANGRRETVNCGSGRRDVVRADRSDRLRGCERRRVVR